MDDPDSLALDQREFLVKLGDTCQRTGCSVWRLFHSELHPANQAVKEVIRDVPDGLSFHTALQGLGYIKVEPMSPSQQIGVEWEKLELTVLPKTLQLAQRGSSPTSKQQTPAETACYWWRDKAEAAFRDEFEASLCAPHLFETEFADYHPFSRGETGDAVWLVQKTRGDDPDPVLVGEQRKLSGQAPQTILLSEVVAVNTDWFVDGELARIQNKVT
jgi:hypothetical protein